ncbi:hypothetical protein ABTZ99_41375 [Actinosynnema sp. NPDC002837]
MAFERLSREWTPEEVATEAKDSVEDLPEARTTHRRPLVSGRAAGGAEHRPGDEDYQEDRLSPERPARPDPPSRPDSPEAV